jgi:glycosyltransferase involved in cell wall biosynthesis
VHRVGVDATSVAPDGKGISRVQVGTVRALRDLGRYDLVVFARHPELLGGAFEVRDRPALRWEQLGLPRAFREHRLDAMLTWTERLPLGGGGRFLVWLFEPPTHRVRQNRIVGASAYQRASDVVTLALWRRSLRRADLVLTGSDATRDAVRSVAPGARTVYPGLEPAFSPGPGRPGRYVLHVASRDPRDDTATALAAFARVRAGEDVRLLVAGSAEPREADGVEFLGRVPDTELIDLYRGASAYLDTSLYEGFGFQVLEAMACGAPVVATRVTSVPEVAGDAAFLCTPGAVGEIADALRRVLGDPGLAEDLRSRGLARASSFSWERAARQLADAIG